MNITEKTLTTLEFDKIRAMLAEVCPTSGSAALAHRLCPTDRIDVTRERQTRTTDARRLCDAKGMKDVLELIHKRSNGAELMTDHEPLPTNLYFQ